MLSHFNAALPYLSLISYLFSAGVLRCEQLRSWAGSWNSRVSLELSRGLFCPSLRAPKMSSILSKSSEVKGRCSRSSKNSRNSDKTDLWQFYEAVMTHGVFLCLQRESWGNHSASPLQPSTCYIGVAQIYHCMLTIISLHHVLLCLHDPQELVSPSTLHNYYDYTVQTFCSCKVVGVFWCYRQLSEKLLS